MDMKKIGISVAALAVLAVPLAGVLAQEESAPEGIRVSPAILEQDVEPGETMTGVIRVTNESDRADVFYLRSRNIERLYSSGLPQLAPVDQETAYEFASWVVEDQVGTRIGPRETREIRYRIDVPEDATPGGHFGVIFFTKQPPEIREDFIGAQFEFQVGTVFNLRVAGTATEDVFIGSIETDQSVYKTSQPRVALSIDVENRGTVLERPQGTILITTLSGERVASVPINENAGASFPGQVRTFESFWEPGDFTIGRFQAVASVVHGVETRKTATVTTSFWVLPMKLIFGILGGLILLFAGGYIWLRTAVQKRVREVLGNTEAANRAKEGVAGALPPEAPTPLPKGALITVGVLLALFIFLLVLIFLFA